MPRDLGDVLDFFILIVAIPLVAALSVALMYWRGGRGWKAHVVAGVLVFMGLGWLFMWYWAVYVEGMD